MKQSLYKMEPQKTSLAFCIFVAVICSANGLDLHWCETPSTNKQLQCSVDGNSFSQDIFTIIDLTIFDVTNNRTAQKVATITVMDTDPQVDYVSDSFLAIEGSISQHNADLVVTFSNQTYCLLCSYMCELNFINPDGHPVVVRSSTVKSPQIGSDDLHSNVSVGVASQLVAAVDRLTNITHSVEDHLTDRLALLEKKLDNITLLEKKLDNITLLEMKLDNITVHDQKLDNNIVLLEEKLDNMARLEEKLDNMARLEEKLDNITRLEEKLDIMAHLEEKLDNMARLEEKLDNITRLEEKLDIMARLEEKLDNMARLEEKLDNITRLEEKLDNMARLEEKLDNMARLEEKLDNITGLLTQASVEDKMHINCYKGMASFYTPPRTVITVLGNLTALCDTNTDGGGWVVIQRRTNGRENFYRGWADYKAGFGDVSGGGDYWLGNEAIHQLTSMGKVELRVEMEKTGQRYYAQYSTFSIGNETTAYRLNVDGYSGDAGDSLHRTHNRMKFSTMDRDNDVYTRSNCAERFHGAWWYNNCHASHLNGLWGPITNDSRVYWLYDLGNVALSYTEMKIRLIS